MKGCDFNEGNIKNRYKRSRKKRPNNKCIRWICKKFLISKKFSSRSELKAKQDSNAFKKSQEKEEAEKISDKLSKIQLKIKVKSGANGKIFGGVSSKEIAENLEKQYQIKVDKKKIDLKETIKTLGMITVDIKLFEGVIGKVKVDIISE